jgi:hypothetical protein
MVVGRTLWDFVIEVIRMPGFGMVLIALLILLEVILILILVLVHNGLIGIKISYGGLGLELYNLARLKA